jgi:Zn-finger nucleic acid-binding protein
MRCPGAGCAGRMTSEERFGVTVDRCEKCSALWFDAEELDRWLGDAAATDDGRPESLIPARGVGSRPCPRCTHALDTAGWTGLVLDRCKNCRGLFVEAGELTRLQADGLPGESDPFELRLRAAFVDLGWTLLGAQGLTRLVMRLLLRA